MHNINSNNNMNSSNNNNEDKFLITCNTLVEVFGFPLERAMEAVQAISDKSDVTLAYNWLLDNGAEDKGGPVIPTQRCPHISGLSMIDGVSMEHITYLKCVEGCASSENWCCLICGTVRCSRYCNSHNIKHFQKTNHALALSLNDFSVWCYECSKYIKCDSSPELEHILQCAHHFKFISSDTKGQSVPVLRANNLIRTGLMYDHYTEIHCNEDPHGAPIAQLECPERTKAVVRSLEEGNIMSKCVSIETKSASMEDIAVHSSQYMQLLHDTQISASHIQEFLAYVREKNSISLQHSGEDQFPADVYLNTHSFAAAMASVGSAIDAVKALSNKIIDNGFVLCRPPGHHACADTTSGFCLLNNVAITADYARRNLGYKKVLIIDWDVHHGNGIQEIFYDSCDVLYVSVHRHEHTPGVFFDEAGSAEKCGSGKGLGFNVNIPLMFSTTAYHDDDYNLVFNALVLPIAHQFSPDLILVASGFDASAGDPLGGGNLTPSWFGGMTEQLKTVCPSVLLLLEGGYNVEQIFNCTKECILSLLKPLDEADVEVKKRKPEINPATHAAISEVLRHQEHYWEF